MSEYNVDEYRKVIEELAENAMEIVNAAASLKYESGPNGITDRAEIYLNDIKWLNQQSLELTDRIATNIIKA